MSKGFIHATLDLSLPVMRDRFLLELAGDYAAGAHCDVRLNDREYAIVAGLIEAGVINGECEEPTTSKLDELPADLPEHTMDFLAQQRALFEEYSREQTLKPLGPYRSTINMTQEEFDNYIATLSYDNGL